MRIPRVLQRFWREPEARYEGNIVEVKTPADCRSLFAKEFAIVVKYSTGCSFSLEKFEEVVRFYRHHPEVTIHALSVTNARAAAILIEDHTGVRHQTPQVLAMRKGVVVDHASHTRITEEFLAMLPSD